MTLYHMLTILFLRFQRSSIFFGSLAGCVAAVTRRNFTPPELRAQRQHGAQMEDFANIYHH